MRIRSEGNMQTSNGYCFCSSCFLLLFHIHISVLICRTFLSKQFCSGSKASVNPNQCVNLRATTLVSLELLQIYSLRIALVETIYRTK